MPPTLEPPEDVVVELGGRVGGDVVEMGPVADDLDDRAGLLGESSHGVDDEIQTLPGVHPADEEDS